MHDTNTAHTRERTFRPGIGTRMGNVLTISELDHIFTKELILFTLFFSADWHLFQSWSIH